MYTMSVTEEKIKRAAMEIFSKKGFAATKTRDIASAADVNISTLHYYYRNKDTIYKVVADEVFHLFNRMVATINVSDLTFKERIRKFIFQLTDICIENPYFPSFMVFESQQNPDKIFGKVDFKVMDNTIENELNALIQKKIIRPISYPDYALNVSGLVLFPFLNKHMLQLNNGLTDEDFNKLVENRKEMVADIIIDYMYSWEKE